MHEQPTIAERASPFFAGMEVAPGLRLLRELGAGGMGSVWLADHVRRGAVAVKLMHAGGSASERERLIREASLTARVEHPHAVRVLEQGETAHGPFLVLELLEGESLAARMSARGRLDLADVRRVVAQVADVLRAVHAVHVLHRDIKPSNVMLLAQPGPLSTKVVDFGIARATDDAYGKALTSPGVLVGTLQYMSPEQLIEGRSADVHSDLWSLSVLAYEALTGRPPFRGSTRAAICAAMVLRRYERPSKVDASLPTSLDDWFERAFTLDRPIRFASAEELAETFDAAARGEGDARARIAAPVALRIPDRLFGRDREVAAVLAAFRKAAAGRSRVLFVSGYSGIGKTALVGAVEQTLAEAGATFVAGKFDQFNRGTPYDSLIQALRELIRKKLRQGPTTLAGTKASLADHAAAALVEVIPELEQLVGPQPPLDPVSPEEARNRFRHAVERLVSSLASAEHPLVLFFDDLQWADLASVDLITNLATDPESRHVLFVGAYRDNEIGEAHPLKVALERLAPGNTSTEHLALGPLSEDAVLDLVSATFPGSTGRARLASACHAKTHGNAFFLRRLLESLCEDGLLRFDATTGQWAWELAAIEARAITDDVVDFVAAEIRRMPAASGRAIGAAACVGDTFDLETLAIALGTDRPTTLESLRLALASELVVPAAEETSLVTDPRRDVVRVTFRFAHDRIRQAARSLVSDEAAARIHLSVARTMLAQLDGAERERRIFELADHLNLGLAEHGVSREEAALLRRTNLAAAKRATSSAAFEPAYRYMRRALAHLADDPWGAAYAETFAMHVDGARAAYLSGDYATMQSLVEVAVSHASSALDRVTAREVELHALVSQQKLVDVVRLSVSLLGELGLSLPLAPTRQDVEKAVGETVLRVVGVTADDLAKIPMALDPNVVAMLRIQNDTMSSAYLAVPNLLPIMGCNIVRMTLESGICKESPYGFAILGLVLSAGNAIDLANAVGKLALELLGRVGDRSVQPRTLHVVTSFVKPFVEHVRGAIDDARTVFRIGMDVGDFEYAAWALHTMVRDGMFGGMELDELEPMYDRTLAILEHHRQVAAIGVNAPFGQLIANLRGRAADPRQLVGPKYDENVQRELFVKIDYRGAVFVLAVLGGYARFLFRDLAGARDVLEAGAAYADGAVATYNQVYFQQLRALSILGLARPGTEEAARALEATAPNLAQLETWQEFSPVNQDHRVLLVRAERARVAGDAAADGLYDRAIVAATKGRFAPEVAVANELAFRHHDAKKNDLLAAAYCQEAIAAYERWGATAKAAQLRSEGPGPISRALGES